MARERGTFNFSASLEVKKQAPLDARQTYITYAELTQQSTWVDTDSKVWLFKGLVVPVNYNGQHALFMLINPDNYTSTSSWVRVDGAGVESSIFEIGNINTLNTASTGENVTEVLGNYADFLKAYNNKIIIANIGEYKSVASVKFYMDDDSTGHVEICVTEYGFGNPIVRYRKIKVSEFNWDSINPIEEKADQKLVVGEDIEQFDNIYFLGDISTVVDNGPSDTMNNILTPFADFKTAYNEKKIFIAKTAYGQVYVQVKELAENQAYLLSYIINDDYNFLSVSIQALVINDNTWDSYHMIEKNVLATKSDLTKKVSSVNAAPEKGIEIGGTTQYPTVGIKLDPTQGNVTLSLGENGLKANDTTALRDVTGQNFIKKNGTNVEGHLNLTYNNDTKKINLEGFDSAVIASIDATTFIKDGMIDTVELVTDPESHDPGTYLVITFNTDAGKEAIYLDVSSLIAVYEGTNGVRVTGKYIHLIIDPTSEPYLLLSDEGIKVKGVDAKINEVVEQAIIEALAWHEA